MLHDDWQLDVKRDREALSYRATQSFPDHENGKVIKYSYTAACVTLALYYWK